MTDLLLKLRGLVHVEVKVTLETLHLLLLLSQVLVVLLGLSL